MELVCFLMGGAPVRGGAWNEKGRGKSRKSWSGRGERKNTVGFFGKQGDRGRTLQERNNSIPWSGDSNHLHTAMLLIYYIGVQR